ncbi:MAG: RHS repeat-associated core domain-containing protein [Actinobacteria bacterium]|nr:MAG: RHS repeat-associated core domain-containing protein [Actinomycetota bacterium]
MGRTFRWSARLFGGKAALWVLLAFLLFPVSAVADDESSETPHPGHLISVKPDFAPRRRSAVASSGLALLSTAAPTTPFTQCPAVGYDTSCGLLVDITGAGIAILQDPSQGPYDAVEDTLIGAINRSSKSVSRLSLVSNTDLFGFDGDGLCFYGIAGCPFGPTGYEGPRTSFSSISPDLASGVVEFSPPLEPGESTYFSLEESLSSTTVVSGGPSLQEQGGARNGSEHRTTCHSSRPVNCATGVFWHEFTDIAVPGRGVPLHLTRTYSSINAATDGPFGRGWSSSYDMSLSLDPETGAATVHEEGGSSVTFPPKEGGGFETPPRVLASLEQNGDGTFSFSRFSDHVGYVFGADGRLLREVDRNGAETQLTYSAGKLESVVDPSGRAIVFAYGGGGHIVSATDPMGRSTSFEYDGEGDLVGTVDPLGRTWSFTYDSAHRLLTMTDPRGGTTSNTYDASGRVELQADPMGRETKWEYAGDPTTPEGGTTDVTDPRGNVTRYQYRNLELVSVIQGFGTADEATTSYRYDPTTLGVTQILDPNFQTTHNAYDARGNLVETTNQDGWTTVYEYGPGDEVVAATDPRGTTTTYAYDSNGNLLKKSTPLSGTGTDAVTTYAYEAAAGEVTKMTDAVGGVTEIGYDPHGNRTSLRDPNGSKTSFEYDLDGRLTARVGPAGNEPGGDPSAHRTTYSYDAAGQLESVTDPLGGTTEYTYDENGNQTAITDALGHTTERAFDADDELTLVTRADGSILQNKWDAGGNRIAQIDAAGNATEYAYDALDRQISVTDPNGRTTSYGYDPAGNRTEMIVPEGWRTEFRYDGVGQLTEIEYSDSTPDVYQAYDEDGNRILRYDGSGESTFTYDSLNRMTAVTDGTGATVGYEYDLAGRLTKITYPSGHQLERGYDSAGNLTSVTDWLGKTTDFSYDAESNLTEVLYPNGVHTERGFDALGRLESIADDEGGNALASFAYQRDGVGQVTTEEAVNGAQNAIDFSHDQLGRLTAAGGVPYGYDSADNPITFGGETTQAFDPANQLVLREEPGPEPPEEGPGGEGEEPGLGGEGGSAQTPTAQDGPPGSQQHSAAQPTVEATVTAKRVRDGALKTSKLPPSVGGDLLLAFVSADGSGQRVTAISGGGSRWRPVQRADEHGGAAEIWQARAGSGPPGKVTVHLARGTRTGVVAVAAVAGDGLFVQAHAAAHGRASKPVNSLRPSPRSLLWAVGHSIGQKRPAAVSAGQRLVAQVFDRHAGTAGWVQTARGGGAVAASVEASRWSLAAVSVGSEPGAVALDSSGEGDKAARSQAGLVPRELAPAGAHDAISLSSASGSTVPRWFTYDYRGNRIFDQSSDSLVEYRYDLANRLIEVGDDVSYAYDGDGLRVGKTVAGSSTHFVWNQVEELPELLQEGSTEYVYGPEGEAIEQVTGGTPTYLHQDQQGSIRLLTDAGGEVVGRYDYTAWGEVATHTGTSTNFQFDGEYTDPETGFQYLRARYYDPSTGQFLTRDPAEETTRSRYGFARSNPVDASDPLGLWAVGWCVGGSGTVAPGVSVTAQGEICTWEGGTGWRRSWSATTFTATGGAGVGLDAGASGDVGFVFDRSVSKPDDLAGPGCSVGGSVHAIAGVSGSVGCRLDSFGLSLDLGLEAGASAAAYVGATNVLWSSTGFTGWGGASPPKFEPLCNQQAYDPYWNIA